MRFSLMLVGQGLVLLVASALVNATDQGNGTQKSILKPFSTDGCSMWIDGTPTQPALWRHCCVVHDKSYWVGGSKEQRDQADRALLACVTEAAGKGMGNSMYVGVVPGGSPYWATTYRWGYGWTYLEHGKPRGYKILTDEEQAQVIVLLPLAEKTIADDAIAHPISMKVIEQP